MIYTGIGSRKTPRDILDKMTLIARGFSALGWTLRSGGAEKADHAFEIGAKRKRIYLPWDSFNNKHVDGTNYIVPKYEPEWVWDYHLNPYRLSAAAMKLMSRNTYQVLGDDLDNPLPSTCLVCYTSDGKASGGTGQAMRIAKDFKVPIYNLFFDDQYYELIQDYALEDYIQKR